MNEELRALDREWAELAGWKCQEIGRNDFGSHFRFWCDSPSGLVETEIGTDAGDEDGVAIPFSSDPAACFGPGGPWEWMVGQGLEPVIDTTVYDGSPLFTVAVGARSTWRSASTIFEAITRCAIEARRRLEESKT